MFAFIPKTIPATCPTSSPLDIFSSISLALFIAFSLLIIGCFSEHSLLHRVFSGRIWNHLGALSYSMLLLHYPVMLMTNRVCHIIEIDDKVKRGIKRPFAL